MANINAPVTFHTDFLGAQAAAFERGASGTPAVAGGAPAVKGLKGELQDALEKLHGDASDPSLLASYQAAFSSYNIFRNAATNTIKGFKEIDTAIISAAR